MNQTFKNMWKLGKGLDLKHKLYMNHQIRYASLDEPLVS
jgi:hypothetical protein